MTGLLFVCRANVCRSVLAERLASAHLGRRRFPIRSAGLAARGTGADPCQLVTSRLGALGLSEEHSAGAQLATVADLAGADLILVATTDQRSEVARRCLSSRSRTFTLLEAARLTRLHGLEDVSSLAQFAARLNLLRTTTPPPKPLPRSLWRPAAQDPLDILDGHLGSAREHHRTVTQVENAVEELLNALSAIEESG